MKKSMVLLSFLMTASLFVTSVQAMQPAEVTTATDVTEAADASGTKKPRKKVTIASQESQEETHQETLTPVKPTAVAAVEEKAAAKMTLAQRIAFKQRVKYGFEKLYALSMSPKTAYTLALMCGVCHVYPELLPWVISSLGFAAPMAPVAEAAAVAAAGNETFAAAAAAASYAETAKAMALVWWTVAQEYGVVVANVLYKSLMPAIMGRFIQTDVIPAMVNVANTTVNAVSAVGSGALSGVKSAASRMRRTPVTKPAEEVKPAA